MDIKQPKKF